MRKQFKINYETVKGLFDAGIEGEVDGCTFRIHGGPEPVSYSLPRSAVRRLYHLGNAFNIRQLRYLERNTKIVIGWSEVPQFIADLGRLKILVNDEVTHHYVNQLIGLIKTEPGQQAKHIAVATGDF